MPRLQSCDELLFKNSLRDISCWLEQHDEVAFQKIEAELSCMLMVCERTKANWDERHNKF